MKRRLELEALENRTLLSASATLVNREVILTGTTLADNISIADAQVFAGIQRGPLGNWVVVYEAGVRLTVTSGSGFQIPQRFEFRAADFDRIRVNAGDGNDTVTNHTAYRTFLNGEAGNDSVFGGAGTDWLYGGAGNDLLAGYDGVDVLVGNDGNDHLYGGAGNDHLYGDAGNDWLDGGGGSDNLLGHDGYDTAVWDQGDRLWYSIENLVIPTTPQDPPPDLPPSDPDGPPCPWC
jgi:Ca2+-binding RTX toxin-like protein